MRALQSGNPFDGRRRTSSMSSEVWHNPNLVCLQKAVLCANCEVISEGLRGRCTACGSEALLSLNRLLGGSADSESSFELAALSSSPHPHRGCSLLRRSGVRAHPICGGHRATAPHSYSDHPSDKLATRTLLFQAK